MRRPLRVLALICIVAVIAATGCSAGESSDALTPPPPQPEAETPAGQEPPATMDLYSRISGYAAWKAAPDFAEPAPAKGPHGEQVRIFLDPAAEQGYFNAAANSASDGHAWPTGSIVVKEILVGGEVTQLAAMEKTDDGWYWGEWSADGDPVVEEGVGVEPCEGCHSKGGTDGTLGVLLNP